MALTLSSTISFVKLDYPVIGNLDTASVSLPANSLVVLVIGTSTAIDDYTYPNTPGIVTGTNLAWTYVSGATNNDGTNYQVTQIWYGKNTSAQTVQFRVSFVAFGLYPLLGAVAGYVFTGHNATTPSGAVGGGQTGTITTTAADSYVISGIADTGSATYTSSNMTYQAIANGNADAFAAYASRPTAGSFTASYASGPFAVPAYEIIEILAAGGGTAHTASGTATATATGTAAMSNARVGAGTGTGTATGTGAASRGQSVTGSASVTASATAAMSSTQTMSASGSVTASGTAEMSRTQVIGGSGTGTGTGTANGSTTGIITFGGTGTGTATGTGGIEKVTNLYRSGEVYRNVSLYPASIDLVTAGGTATGTATGTGGIEKVTNPYRFGNVYRNAGTYPGGAALVGCDPSIIVAEGSAAMTKTRYLEATATATATSDAGMTHTFYIFKPPTREISPLSLDPYYQLVGHLQGKTLVKRDGVWKVVQNRQEDWLDQCEYVFKGGRENRINGTEKAELESAGYTVETRTS